MLALRGLAWLLALQSVGELLARGLHLPFPGPVIGMLLLLLVLRWRVVREPVGACADFLLANRTHPLESLPDLKPPPKKGDVTVSDYISPVNDLPSGHVHEI